MYIQWSGTTMSVLSFLSILYMNTVGKTGRLPICTLYRFFVDMCKDLLYWLAKQGYKIVALFSLCIFSSFWWKLRWFSIHNFVNMWIFSYISVLFGKSLWSPCIALSKLNLVFNLVLLIKNKVFGRLINLREDT